MATSDAMSREEKLVLGTFKRLGRSIEEDEYHLIHRTMDFAGKGLGFEYQLTYWNDVDKRFDSKLGAVPYSPKLHEIIESLIRRGHIKRNEQNPLELECC